MSKFYDMNDVVRLESVEASGEDTYKLSFSCRESAVEIHCAYLPPDKTGDFLCPGAELEPEALEILEHAAACCRAEHAALRLVARAEQCSAGLDRKLRQRGHGASAVRAVIERLCGLDMVNDSRYAELWLRYRVSYGAQGPRRLCAGLQARGIDRNTAKTALEKALEGGAEGELLERCLRKAGLDGAAAKRFLKAEGFSSAVITCYFEDTSVY